MANGRRRLSVAEIDSMLSLRVREGLKVSEVSSRKPPE
jgi:hypothetical protein